MAANGEHRDFEQFDAPPQPNTDVPGYGMGPQVMSTTDDLEIMCGPLLNYRRMGGEHTDNPTWHGSILIVTTPGQKPGPCTVRGNAGSRDFAPAKLYEDPRKGFWRYEIDVPFQETQSEWQYSIPRMVPAPTGLTGGLGGINHQKPMRFFVPSKYESMRIMFHSCNGFSVGTDMEIWQGPSLWNDVLRVHEQAPFHVMIGGGDQIYNDSVRTDGPLKPWTAIGNPRKRRDFPFDEEMRAKCDQFYFENYVKWYSTEPFHSANGQIPQLNIWDDHDIIDGFGSYTDHFMRCAVFRGIGGVAHKYYMLFQHHLPPPPSTFTTDAPNRPSTGQAPDSKQMESTFVAKITEEDPSYIIGPKHGPYVEEKSRNMYCQLGRRVAFAGLDARTERTRHQINYPETYEKFFNHISSQIQKSNGSIRHLVLLLGVPIAYPRLQWLENILQSPLIAPIKFLNKRFGIAGGLFNQFDGNVDLVDDLDDHYTAHQHKKERKELIHRLQEIAKQNSVRVTILGGDVHLAALGRFYSNPDLNISAEQDHRYMANIVSSAITNKPPPSAVANLLAKRNKIHHLDHETDETLLELFNEQPGAGEEGVKPKSAANNFATMPSRNYAIITESNPHTAEVAAGGAANGHLTNGTNGVNGEVPAFKLPDNPRHPIHQGEQDAGTKHPAAGGLQKTGLSGIDGLDVTIRVEKNPLKTDGQTAGYGFSIPALDVGAYKTRGEEW